MHCGPNPRLSDLLAMKFERPKHGLLTAVTALAQEPEPLIWFGNMYVWQAISSASTVHSATQS